MRCPYCRQIMADTSERCARCGAVARDGRWVRGSDRGDRGAAARSDLAPTAAPTPTATPPTQPSTSTTASSPGTPPSIPTSGRRVSGCAIAAVALGIVVVLAFAGGILAIVGANRSNAPTTQTGSPRATWSPDGRARFEAACRSNGAEADTCECLRGELEQRFTESQVDSMVAVLSRGSSLSADVERQFREAERSCGTG